MRNNQQTVQPMKPSPPPTYLWQRPDWPRLTCRIENVAPLLAEVHLLRGKLMGRISMFGYEEQHTSMLESMTSEVVHSSRIEGQDLNRQDVRSSLAHQLHLPTNGLPPQNHFVEGVVQMMVDATQHYDRPLTAERLCAWHHALFPYGMSGMAPITVDRWREGKAPMQVVSGAMGHERVHYEAPPSESVPAMMQDLLQWVESDDKRLDPLVEVALIHLAFVTIHPFDDGNGRLCRTVTEMLLSRIDHTGQRFYSLSSQIMLRRSVYYNQLEHAQKGPTDVTDWVIWFLQTLKDAVSDSLDRTEIVVRKRSFWNTHESTALNDRQRKMINRMLDGFEGKMNSSKWYKICHCSQDTATRDINDLLSKGILYKLPSSGRSTCYELCHWKQGGGGEI